MDNAYFIQCGNWCLCMYADTIEYDTLNDCYVELATRALEIVFGDAEFTDDRDDYYALMNEDGINVLNDENEWPMPTFTTKIHVLSSKNGEPDILLTSLKTSDIFVNAAQWENYELALDAEEREK
jgi:hypothetical protein